MKQKIRSGGSFVAQVFLLIFLENILHTAIVSEFAVHAQKVSVCIMPKWRNWQKTYCALWCVYQFLR